MFDYFSFFLLTLAAVGAHRIYNYEDIFSSWRRLVSKGGRWTKFLSCSACNAFWISLAAVCVWTFVSDPIKLFLFTALAIYVPVRATIWLYAWGMLLSVQAHSEPKRTPISPMMSFSKETVPPDDPRIKKSGCSTCGAKTNLKEEQAKNLSYDRRFVLMTMFNDFKPSYSLTSVVLDQARMLAVNPKWLVQIWVSTVCRLDDVPTDLPANVEIKKVLPPIPLPEDKIEEKGRAIFTQHALNAMMVLGNATIIVHDLLFITSYTTIAAAIHRNLGGIKGFIWYHFCHSAPAKERPTGDVSKLRATLPDGHKLFCLAESQADALAAYYGTTRDRVLVMPNARDIRTLASASPRMVEFIRKHRLLDADIVQVFPLSTPRAGAKGLSQVIQAFAEMARMGKLVRLVVVNAHANNNEATIALFKAEAQQADLPDDALIFTSETFTDVLSVGLPTSEVHLLFQLSNVFIFPTQSEACSMTLMEAALAGCLLVLNQDVPALADIVSFDKALHFSWGSVNKPGYTPKPVTVARQIIDYLDTDLSNRSKRSVLRTHNWDAVGERMRMMLA